MLPDGAEAQSNDWTVFFLNQKPFNTISPVLALDSPDIQTTALPGCNAEDSKSNKPELLCVLNLVRTKHDKTLDRYVHNRHLYPCSTHYYEVAPKFWPLQYVQDIHISKFLRQGVYLMLRRRCLNIVHE